MRRIKTIGGFFSNIGLGILVLSTMLGVGCSNQGGSVTQTASKDAADLIIENGKLYSFSWGEPSIEGVPSKDAPYENGKWKPDGQAIAIRDGIIVAVGSNEEIALFKAKTTKIIDVSGAVILPGFVDSHSY